MTWINDVYEFRLRDNEEWYDIRRYADGKWIPDDGEYDLAFAFKYKGAPIVMYVELPYRKFLLWSLMQREGEDIKKHPKENPWHYMYVKGKKQLGRSWDKDKHPNEIAGRNGMNFMAKKHSCSNGRSVKFNPTDKHIKAGLVRNRETKEIIKPPEFFDCIYCGTLMMDDKSCIGCNYRIDGRCPIPGIEGSDTPPIEITPSDAKCYHGRTV